MFNKRAFRLAAGIVILLVVLYSAVPFIYKFNSLDGVVNGRITVMRTPISGSLNFTGNTHYGSYFKDGSVIASVKNDRVDHSTLYALKTELKSLEGRIATLDERIASLQKLYDSLSIGNDKHNTYSAKQLEFMIEQERHKHSQELAENARAKKEFDSSAPLSEKNLISKRDFERYEANLNGSNERLFQYDNRIKELSNSLDAIKFGIHLGDSNNDVPYSKQRMDQLVVDISMSVSVRDEAKSRIAGIESQIKEELAKIEKQETFEVVAPFDCLVWRMPSSEGSRLTPDAEVIVLLDCASVFLDVAVSESQFANIKPGDKVAYRLIGAPKSYTGTVTALRGSGGALGDLSLAAAMSIDPKKHFRVWIAADRGDLDLTPENFYQIGRRVEAKLARRWSPVSAITRFIDVF